MAGAVMGQQAAGETGAVRCARRSATLVESQARLMEVKSTVWTEVVAALPGTTVFQPPVSESSLIHCATVLGHPLPANLATLLRESNGIEGEYGEGLIWSAERIAFENQSLRDDAELATLYMPFDPLLFFADAGGGDLFALLPRIDRPDVFVWNHEDDSRTWVAPSLAKYLEWWPTGQIKV
jgi:hypothetical protein